MFISTISTNIKTYSIMHQLSLDLLCFSSPTPRSLLFCSLYNLLSPFIHFSALFSSVNDKPFLAHSISVYFLPNFNRLTHSENRQKLFKDKGNSETQFPRSSQERLQVWCWLCQGRDGVRVVVIAMWISTPLLNGPSNKNRDQRSGILHIVRDP